MKHEYSIALMVLIVVTCAFAITSTENTGEVVRGTWSGYFRETREAPVLSESINSGYEYAQDSSKVCIAEMRYQGRDYSRYIRCCKDECYPRCQDTELTSSGKNDCLWACEESCVDLMTQHYLAYKPGEWR